VPALGIFVSQRKGSGMAQEYDDARVQEAIKHLQRHSRNPYPSGGLHDTYTPALLALKNALYQSGGYTHETALREARAIAERVCPPSPQRSRLFWVLLRVRRWLRRWRPRSGRQWGRLR
jgi:hypothetical protein